MGRPAILDVRAVGVLVGGADETLQGQSKSMQCTATSYSSEAPTKIQRKVE